jgi:hypothetical protein
MHADKRRFKNQNDPILHEQTEKTEQREEIEPRNARNTRKMGIISVGVRVFGIFRGLPHPLRFLFLICVNPRPSAVKLSFLLKGYCLRKIVAGVEMDHLFTDIEL